MDDRTGPSSSSAVFESDLEPVLEPALTISAVSRLTGITATTLRVWETRYGLSPTRTTTGGHRRYSATDIELLRGVQRLIAGGVSTGEAARVVLASRRPRSDLPRLVLDPLAHPSAHRLARAGVDLDGPTCAALLRSHLRQHGPAATWEAVLRPVLHAIGAQWAEAAHGAAVEHLITHLATVALGEATGVGADRWDPPVLLACMPGELHDLPLTALGATLAGPRATYLGARTPAAALAEAVERQRPAVVVLFCMMPDWAHPDVLIDLPRGPQLVAAGPGWRSARLPRSVQHVDDLAGATKAVMALV